MTIFFFGPKTAAQALAENQVKLCPSITRQPAHFQTQKNEQPPDRAWLAASGWNAYC
jgi:hypothetical protein